jgi:cytochrome c biogenesis protein CcdA
LRGAVLGFCILLIAPLSAGADTRPTLYLFWQLGCPHCERAQTFVGALERRRPAFQVRTLEISQDPHAAELFVRVVGRLGLVAPVVPLTVIGDEWVVGFRDADSSGREIEEALSRCLAGPCPDHVAELARAEPGATHSRLPSAAIVPARLWLPLIGDVATANLSVPLLTVLVAAIDGFNPCAMWALVFLIGLLLGLPNRRRMWLLGGAFLAASALVYFLILTAWLNLFLLFGAVAWVRIALGIGAVAGGSHYLREYARRGAEVCPVTAPARRQRVLERLRAFARERHLGVALVGTFLLACAVTLVDLVCSVGLPAVYTGMLARSDLSLWQYYALVALYVGVFMADDAVVLVMAMATLHLAHGSARYARHSQLVGGTLLIAIGVLLILRPDWLRFG